MIASFGLFLVLSYVAAYWVFRAEYRRKEAEGLIHGFERTVRPVPPVLIGIAVTFFAAKIIYRLLNRGIYIGEMQSFVFSFRGSWPGAVAAGVLAWLMARKRVGVPERRWTRPHELMDLLLFWCGAIGTLGSVAFAFFEDPHHFVFGGLSFYGGFICGALTYLYINWKYRIPLAVAADIGAPGMMLAYAVGRIGCQVAGDGDWGVVSGPRPNWLSWLPDWAWAYKYPHNTIHQGEYIPGCGGANCNILSYGVYPTPLYETLLCGLIFLFLLSIRKHIKTPGILYSIFAILSGAERFFIEFIRVNPRYTIGSIELTQAQLLALGWIISGILVFFFARRKPIYSLATLFIFAIPPTKPYPGAFPLPPTKPHRDTFNIPPAKPYRDPQVKKFFERDTGWIASDASFTLPLKDGRVLWLMGDSYIDHYDKRTATVPCLFQVRNSGLIQPKNNWNPAATKTLLGPAKQSLFKNEPNNEDHLLWPNNGFQVGDTAYIYCAGIANDTVGLLFKVTGQDFLAKMDLRSMRVVGYDSLQNFNGISFGLSFDTDEPGDYIYTWGYRSAFIVSNLYVARFQRTAPRKPWTFWTGKTWSTDTAQLKTIATGASNGVYVAKVRNKYVIISTEFSVGCDQGKHIYAATSDHITGPFTARHEIYTITDTVDGHYPFFYAPSLHPEYINANNEILITYNVNGYAPCIPMCDKNNRVNPNWYRPRGIRIPLKLIDPAIK